MKATIELPEPVFRDLKNRAEQQGSTTQAVILEAIEKGISLGQTLHPSRSRVSLPLIHSTRPGALRSMTNAEIDDLLG
jgi:hypothetical protein